MLCRLVFPWLAACLLQLVTSDRRVSNAIYDKLVIPDDRIFTVYLNPGQVIKLLYLLQKDVNTLSMTVTPCTTPVSWELEYRNPNQTGKVEVEVGGRNAASLANDAKEYQTNQTVTPASRGLYTLRLAALQKGWVEVYATFLGPPSRLWPRGKLVVRSRPSKGHVYIRWPRTTVDPDFTEYYLLVHLEQERFRTFCQARNALNLNTSPQTSLASSPNHIIMQKTGHRTSWLVRGFEPHKSYTVQVFALNVATNFSYKYAEITNVKYSRPKPRPLSDGQLVTADLKVHEPTLLFRYKVRKEETEKIEVGVTACGEGVVDVELRRRRGNIEEQKTVKGYGVLTVDRPVFGAVYVIKLKLPAGGRPLSAQLVVKGNGLDEPELPEPAEVHEFRGLRSCHEVTLGWVPVEGEATYCLRASQSRKGDILDREPDQCIVEQQLNSLGYSVLQCSNFNSSDKKVVSERLTNLKPGKQYDIQVSVKKGNSKRLSYKLVRVRTKSRCI